MPLPWPAPLRNIARSKSKARWRKNRAADAERSRQASNRLRRWSARPRRRRRARRRRDVHHRSNKAKNH
eukprot:10076755-Alexandrium_andersonii.AAC.1